MNPCQLACIWLRHGPPQIISGKNSTKSHEQDSGVRLEPPRQPEGQQDSSDASCIAAAGLINSICWQGDACSPSQVLTHLSFTFTACTEMHA